MPTPGQEALAEAARLEAARVYSASTAEYRQPTVTVEDVRNLDELARRRAQKAAWKQQAQQRQAATP